MFFGVDLILAIACNIKCFAMVNILAFFSFFFLYNVFERIVKSFLCVFRRLLLQMRVTITGTYFVDTLANRYVYVLNFCV